MRFLLVAILIASLVRPAAAQDDPYAPLDPSRLSHAETRLVQAGLALGGHYIGRLDGAWGGMSQRALAAQRRAMGFSRGTPDWEDAVFAALLAGEEMEGGGWAVRELAPANLSFIAPFGLLRYEYGAEHPTWETPSRDLVIREIVDSFDGTWGMHDWLEGAHVGPDAFYRARPGGAIVSRGRIASGREVYLRTHAVSRQVLVTVLVQWEPSQADRARLVAASFAIGPQQLPYPGRTLLRAADAVVAARAAPPPAPPVPAAPAPSVSTRSAPPPAPVPVGSGSGFFVSPTTVVTNDHVAGDCTALETSDGRSLVLLATDPHRDLALLFATQPSDHWLELSPDAPRLGQPVWALGYPFGGDYNAGLSVTSGILSALAGRVSAGPHMMISAPVQPGNSGGPLLGDDGRVIGIVVARLNAEAVLVERGTLPQNMNFAVPVAELHAFLAERRLAPEIGRPAPPAAGLSADAVGANVHIRCLR